MKNELPPFRMVVEGAKLAAADAYTAERLSSYRNGSEMFVQPVVDSQSKKRKKYWAILRRVISDCPSPWTTVREASNELKRLLGVVDEGHTVNGTVVRYPGSLNDLTEPEFDDFYEGAMLLLYRVTGVDPETLGNETPDTGKDHDSSARNPLPSRGADEGSDGAPPPKTAVAATPTEDPVAEQKREAIAKFLQFATDDSISPTQRLDNLVSVQTAWLSQLPNHAAFVKTCSDTAAKVIRGELPEKDAREYLHSLGESKSSKAEAKTGENDERSKHGTGGASG